MSVQPAMHEETMKVGLLMESARAHQALVEENLQRLKAHTRDLDAVVREEIRRTLIEELQALTSETKCAAQALQRMKRAANLRVALFGAAVLSFGTALPIALVARALPSQADIDVLRTRRAELAASIARLEQQGGRIDWRKCGDDRRLCVRIERKAPAFGEQADYFVVKGY